MWGFSDGFGRYLSRSHTILTRCAVFDGGTASWLGDLQVADGSVSFDANADVQRQCSVTLFDATGTLTPSQFADMLSPNGNEVQLWRGIKQVNEMIPLGIFGISVADIASDVEGGTKIALTGYDRSRRVSLAKFTQSTVIPKGTNVATAILNLLFNRFPPDLNVQYYFDVTAFLTPSSTSLVYQAGDDPWKAARDLAASIGCWLYFDGLGNCVLREIPDPTTLPVDWTYAEGQMSTIVKADKKLDDANTFNGVVVVGESTSSVDQSTTPITATLWDTNPHSPTYYLGKMGKRPQIYQSNLITTQPQAQQAAQGLLNRSLGLAEDVQFDAIVNPAHEPGDVVQVKVTKSKIDSRYILDTFTIPLVGSTMSATTRRRDLT